MSENKLYELTELMRKPENFKNDINEAINLVSKHFRNKYILPIEQEIRICSEQCKKTPTKEIALLEACRPFVKNNDRLDNFINIINGYNIIQRLTPSETEIKAVKDSSIHKDGIYDIDHSCKIDMLRTEKNIGINPILIVILLLVLN